MSTRSQGSVPWVEFPPGNVINFLDLSREGPGSSENENVCKVSRFRQSDVLKWLCRHWALPISSCVLRIEAPSHHGSQAPAAWPLHDSWRWPHGVQESGVFGKSLHIDWGFPAQSLYTERSRPLHIQRPVICQRPLGSCGTAGRGA